MYIYIYTLLLSLLFASMLAEVQKQPLEVLQYKEKKLNKKYAEYILLLLSMAPFILMSGLRYDVGADYFFTYTRIYDLVAQGLSFAQVNARLNCEIGFYRLNKLIIAFGGGYIYLFTICHAIITALFWIAFYEQSDNICLSITLFFCAETFFISLCYVRQFIALAIVFYGLKYLKAEGIKNTVKFTVCVLVAFTFHKSAIIMLLWAVLVWVKVRPEILVAAITVISLCKDRFEILLEKILSFTPYANYIGSAYQSPSRFYSTRPIAYITLFILAYFLYKKCCGDRMYHLMLNTTALLILITVNFDIMPQLDRVTWYFEAVVILFVPYLLNRLENPWLKKAVTVALIAMFAIFTYNSVVVYKAHGVLPYRISLAPDMIFR